MSAYETLMVETDARGVCHLTLNRPDKRNAISGQMIAELSHFAAHMEARVVVLSGAGDVFCAGGDLNWMKAQIEADRATRITEARKLADMLRALNEMPCPLIARIHGGAFGGGVGLACVA
ncbi:MAG: enoyl-CoA hydratase-related protein, partial [Pseudomonadota bacterium]